MLFNQSYTAFSVTREDVGEYTLQEAIEKFSREYSVPKEWLINLANCESSFGKRLVGDGGFARGVYQYHLGTWQWFEKLSGMDLDRESYFDQSKMTAWALQNNLGSHWSCDYKTGKVK